MKKGALVALMLSLAVGPTVVIANPPGPTETDITAWKQKRAKNVPALKVARIGPKPAIRPWEWTCANEPPKRFYDPDIGITPVRTKDLKGNTIRIGGDPQYRGEELPREWLSELCEWKPVPAGGIKMDIVGGSGTIYRNGILPEKDAQGNPVQVCVSTKTGQPLVIKACGNRPITTYRYPIKPPPVVQPTKPPEVEKPLIYQPVCISSKTQTVIGEEICFSIQGLPDFNWIHWEGSDGWPKRGDRAVFCQRYDDAGKYEVGFVTEDGQGTYRGKCPLEVIAPVVAHSGKRFWCFRDLKHGLVCALPIGIGAVIALHGGGDNGPPPPVNSFDIRPIASPD